MSTPRPKKPLAALAIALAAAIAVAVTPSCNNTGCTDNRSSILTAGLYDKAGKKVSVSSLQVGGVDAPGNALVSDGSVPVTAVTLPLRSTAESVQFFMRIDQGGVTSDALSDIITIDYTTVPFLASEECGVVYKYTITHLDYTRNLIDSIALIDPVVDNRDFERIKIFFATEAQQDPNKQIISAPGSQKSRDGV